MYKSPMASEKKSSKKPRSMFSLRIHSVDSPRPEEGEGPSGTTEPQAPPPPPSPPPPPPPGEPPSTEEGSSSNPTATPRIPPSDPRIQELKGIVHLYRTAPQSPHPPLDPLLPACRGLLLFVLAVPNALSTDDFLRFCGSSVDRASGIRVIRNDGTEDRYSVLVKFDDQKSADAFYLNLNGWRFSSAEGEVCHILFLVSVEYTELTEIANTPPAGSTELPTCPVCLERLDQDISGIVATTCDHSFQCSCISQWANSSCSVCRFCQKHSEKPACSICGTAENLWICVICGFVGCGRYKEGHAIRHWKDTQHCYSLDLETQRVWDYVGDTYVHRLNQSKSEDKSDKLKSHCRSTGETCESYACSDESGINGALLNSKIEAIVDEYNRLLASQLESQREYYETLLKEAKEKREKYISEAVEKAMSLKMQDIQLKIENVTKEKKVVANINENLVKNQKLWLEKYKQIEDRERETLKLKDERIHELEEEIRDFTVCIEAQKALDNMGNAGDIRGGTLLPVPSPPPPSTRTRRSPRSSRRN